VAVGSGDGIGVSLGAIAGVIEAAGSGDDPGVAHAARTCATSRKAPRALGSEKAGMAGIIRGLREGVNDDF
jgi:hypothetical protein